jgi:hypothetical protein
MEETSAEISRAYNSPSGNLISPLHLKSADGKLFGSSIFPYKALKACAVARIYVVLSISRLFKSLHTHVCLSVCVCNVRISKTESGADNGRMWRSCQCSIDDEGGAALIFPVRSERKMLNRGGQMGGKAGTWIAQRPNI